MDLGTRIERQAEGPEQPLVELKLSASYDGDGAFTAGSASKTVK